MTQDELEEGEAVFADLSARAGVVAKRLLLPHKTIYLEDLEPSVATELMRQAYREAAAQLFDGPGLEELQAEIDLMIDSMVEDGFHLNGMGIAPVH